MTKLLPFALIAFSVLPIAGYPCDAIGADGKSVFVASEQAIIVWDSVRHEEQFTRIANFTTNAKDLGFLVPTPTMPKLAEARKEAFEVLGAYVARRHSSFGCSKGDDAAAGAELSVSHIGGFEETILSLADRGVVEKWLKVHGFPVSAKTKEWLAPYAQKGWVITAFRVESDAGAATLKPVRMTFQTDQPFYPYREPKAEISKDDDWRSLQVFFLSDDAATAKMDGKPWVAATQASDGLTKEEIAGLGPSLPGVDLSKMHFLTGFLDMSSPRIGTGDVYFETYHQYPTGWIIFTTVVAGIVLLSIRRHRRIRRELAAIDFFA